MKCYNPKETVSKYDTDSYEKCGGLIVLNVLIVDDEKMAVECTAAMLDWEKNEIDQVYKAYGKRQAISVIQEVHVDILICDIEMPKGSGYDLLEWIEENEYRIVAIFLTSHARFEYVSKAMKMKVVDYLLKPVPREELEKTVKNAVALVRREQKRVRDEQHAEYWNMEKEILIREFWKKLCWGTPETVFVRKENAKRAGILLKEGAKYYPALLYYIVKEEKEIPGWTAKEVDFAIENIAAEVLFHCTKSGNIFSIDSPQIFFIYETSNETEQMLRELFQTLIDKWKRYLPFCSFCIYVDRLVTLEELPDVIHELENYQKNAEIYREGVYQIQEQSSIYKEDSDITAVTFIKDYLNYHYKDEITRCELADLVHLNADYLSRVFTETVGCPITEYLLTIRMKRAQKLLMNSKNSIKEVAEQVGYADSSYFSQLFRCKYQISPKEYRKRKGWIKNDETKEKKVYP